jgi:outer membrane biosynthesis protein TonB
LLLLFVLVGFSAPPLPDTDEGILVNFGTDATGFGDIEPSPPAVRIETPPPVPAKTKVRAAENPLLTQNTEEAPEVKKVDPEAAKKKLEKIEADRKIKEQLDEERVLRQEAENKRKKDEADQQLQTDIMNRTKNALANSKNAGTNSTSEGVAGGPGNQGSLTGSVNSKVRGEGGGLGDKGKGISYTLQGRGSRSLPSPVYNYQGEGKVVVEISVDRDGKVFQAIPGAKGSTTLDEYLLKVAKEAALAASFEVKADAPAVQKGTITYNFILK